MSSSTYFYEVVIEVANEIPKTNFWSLGIGLLCVAIMIAFRYGMYGVHVRVRCGCVCVCDVTCVVSDYLQGIFVQRFLFSSRIQIFSKSFPNSAQCPCGGNLGDLVLLVAKTRRERRSSSCW